MKKKIAGMLVVIVLVIFVRKVLQMSKEVTDIYASFVDDEPVGI